MVRCSAGFRRGFRPVWVITRIYRTATFMAGSPQSADIRVDARRDRYRILESPYAPILGVPRDFRDGGALDVFLWYDADVAPYWPVFSRL
jgi:hypothetical protein